VDIESTLSKNGWKGPVHSWVVVRGRRSDWKFIHSSQKRLGRAHSDSLGIRLAGTSGCMIHPSQRWPGRAHKVLNQRWRVVGSPERVDVQSTLPREGQEGPIKSKANAGGCKARLNEWMFDPPFLEMARKGPQCPEPTLEGIRLA